MVASALQSDVQRRQSDTPGEVTGAAPRGGAVQRRGDGIEAQALALHPDHQPGFAAQEAGRAPVQLKADAGEQDCAKVEPAKFTRVTITSIERELGTLYVKGTITVTVGKEVATHPFSAGIEEIAKRPDLTAMGLAANIGGDHGLDAAQTKKLTAALKTQLRKPPKAPEGDG